MWNKILVSNSSQLTAQWTIQSQNSKLTSQNGQLSYVYLQKKKDGEKKKGKK